MIKHGSSLTHCIGLGLIEILITLTLGGVIGIIVIQSYGQTKSLSLHDERIARMQENGRHSIQLLTKLIRSADYWGCIPSLEADTEGNVGWPVYAIQNQVQGLMIEHGIVGTEGEQQTIDAYPYQPDTLSIHGLTNTRTYPLYENIVAGESNAITISLDDTSSTAIKANDIALVSDCVNAEIFQITNDVEQTIQTDQTPHIAALEHTLTPHPNYPSTYRNTSTSISANYKVSQSMIFHGELLQQTFSITKNYDHDKNPLTPGIPCLMRTINDAESELMAVNVENIQFRYGEDLTVPSDYQADQYVKADQVSEWSKVVSVKISLLLRSQQAANKSPSRFNLDGVSVDINDVIPQANGLHYNRQVFSSVVTLRNRVY